MKGGGRAPGASADPWALVEEHLKLAERYLEGGSQRGSRARALAGGVAR